jgi:hypothetical protein
MLAISGCQTLIRLTLTRFPYGGGEVETVYSRFVCWKRSPSKDIKHLNSANSHHQSWRDAIHEVQSSCTQLMAQYRQIRVKSPSSGFFLQLSTVLVVVLIGISPLRHHTVTRSSPVLQAGPQHSTSLR